MRAREALHHDSSRQWPSRAGFSSGALCAALFFLGACEGGRREEPAGGGTLTWRNFSLERLDKLGYDRAMARIPGGNPWTAPKAELGRHLFFDRRLSKDRTLSCSSCHDPGRGWADRTPFSSGLNGQRGRRNAPAVVNRIFSREQFWDGRAGSLEEQAEIPMVSPRELGESHRAIVEKIAGVPGYRRLFAEAYGDEKVELGRITAAIASFERTILVYDTPWHRHEAGDRGALNESARRGLEIFKDNNRGRCSVCHSGPNFTDEKYHNTGVGTGPGGRDDPGRFEVSGAEEDRGRFKTPGLMNVALTAPYMHDGSLQSLEEVAEFYNRGGARKPSWPLDAELKKLKLNSRELKDLVAFLEALTGKTTRVDIPEPLE